MAAELIVSKRAGEIWQKFADAWGSKVLWDAYEWRTPPTSPRPLETVYEYWVDGVCVGWGSLTKHPLEKSYWLSRGLFPEFVDKHLARPLRNALSDTAFRQGAEVVNSIIMKANAKQLEDTFRAYAAGKDEGWKHSGDVWYPVGYSVFSLTRKENDKRKICPNCNYEMANCHCCGGPGFVDYCY